MPLEKRRGRFYSYKSVRIEGLPRKIYNGGGAAGSAHEAFERQERREKQEAREAARVLEHCFRNGDRLWSEIGPWIRLLAASHLLLFDYYCHRGEWRTIMNDPRQRQNSAPPPGQHATDLKGQIEALNARANAGDTEALAEQRVLLDQHPEIWRQLGDLNQLSVIHWSSQLGGDDSFHRESIVRHIAEWKDALLGSDPTHLEIAMADSAVTAKPGLAFAEHRSSGGGSVAAANLKSRRLDRAQHRLNATLRQLAQIQSARRSQRAPASPPPAGMAGRHKGAG